MRFFILFIFLFAYQNTENPEKYFKKKYDKAYRFYNWHTRKLTKLIQENNSNPAIVLSIAFPELIRYNMWKDMLETKANELLYVKKGKPYAFFSIGKFQLKPSFARKVENFIEEDDKLSEKYSYIYKYDTEGIKEKRSERIKRLKSWQWQIRYISVFTKVVERRFAITNMPVTDKIRFMSSAFNHDFLCDSLEVVKWQSIKSFPFGMKRDNPFAYADVALYFYSNDYNTLNIE